MKYILYSTGCPKCRMLEKLMNSKKIDYEIFDDVDKMIDMGFKSVPILSVDGEMYDFQKAFNLIKSVGE